MSKIDDLIAKYCPDGVEWKELGEVCEFKRGKTITAKNAIEGDVPVIAGGQKPSYYHNEANRTGETISISSSGAYAGFVNYWTIPVFLSDSFSVEVNHDILNTKYVFYYLKSKQEEIHNTKKGSGVPHVHGSSIAKFQIPIPPLPVQEAIVSILDKFTALEAELEAELEARTRQYEYYRNELLSFEGKDVEWMTLPEISQNLDAKRKPVKGGSREKGKIPYYGASGIVDYVKEFIFDGDFLLISEDGANLLARKTPIAFSISGKSWVNNHAHVLKFENYATRRLVEYYLNSIDLVPYITGAAQPKLNKNNLNNIPIPIPPIEEQERIVAILDKFDALVNDISTGLPAEIQARRQQYEYYRGKLLTFEPLTA